MTDAPWEPEGIRFYDKASGREMLLIAEGQAHAGWLCYRHREGQWVTLREATDDDRWAIEAAENAAGPDPVEVLRIYTRPVDPTDRARRRGNAARILDELGAGERGEVGKFAEKIKAATALVVHPDDLETVRGVVEVLGRPDLELLPDPRLERGILYAIDQDAIDPYRKDYPMSNLTWTCHVCGERRPDDKIAVHKIDRSAEHDLPTGCYVVNVRYCNDQPLCLEGAPTCDLAKTGATRTEARLDLGPDGADVIPGHLRRRLESEDEGGPV